MTPVRLGLLIHKSHYSLPGSSDCGSGEFEYRPRRDRRRQRMYDREVPLCFRQVCLDNASDFEGIMTLASPRRTGTGRVLRGGCETEPPRLTFRERRCASNMVPVYISRCADGWLKGVISTSSKNLIIPFPNRKDSDSVGQNGPISWGGHPTLKIGISTARWSVVQRRVSARAERRAAGLVIAQTHGRS